MNQWRSQSNRWNQSINQSTTWTIDCTKTWLLKIQSIDWSIDPTLYIETSFRNPFQTTPNPYRRRFYTSATTPTHPVRSSAAPRPTPPYTPRWPAQTATAQTAPLRPAASADPPPSAHVPSSSQPHPTRDATRHDPRAQKHCPSRKYTAPNPAERASATAARSILPPPVSTWTSTQTQTRKAQVDIPVRLRGYRRPAGGCVRRRINRTGRTWRSASARGRRRSPCPRWGTWKCSQAGPDRRARISRRARLGGDWVGRGRDAGTRWGRRWCRGAQWWAWLVRLRHGVWLLNVDGMLLWPLMSP